MTVYYANGYLFQETPTILNQNNIQIIALSFDTTKDKDKLKKPAVLEGKVNFQLASAMRGINCEQLIKAVSSRIEILDYLIYLGIS